MCQDAKSLRVYFVGNSVTDTIIHGALAELAKSLGFQQIWGRHMIPGAPLGWQVANGGIAGEISDNGPQQVRDYLDLFPNARLFIIGMGANDLGTWPDTEAASRRIISNLGRMVQAVVDRGKWPILFNVSHVNEPMFPPRIARDIHGKRDYHNSRLSTFCDEHGIPLADICSLLHDEHFGDELHPNGRGAKIIGESVFQMLPKE